MRVLLLGRNIKNHKLFPSAKLGLIYFLFCFMGQGNVDYFRKKKLKTVKIDFGADNSIQYKKLNTFSDHQKNDQ